MINKRNFTDNIKRPFWFNSVKQSNRSGRSSYLKDDDMSAFISQIVSLSHKWPNIEMHKGNPHLCVKAPHSNVAEAKFY